VVQRRHVDVEAELDPGEHEPHHHQTHKRFENEGHNRNFNGNADRFLDFAAALGERPENAAEDENDARKIELLIQEFRPLSPGGQCQEVAPASVKPA